MGLKERRERERGERREQILRAARILLTTEGLHTTSIAKIAREAELGVGTIYFYFKSKEEIFSAVQMEGLELLRESVDAAVKRKTREEDQLRAAAGVYLEFSREHRDYFDVISYFLSSSRVAFSPRLKEQIDESGNRILSLIEDIVERGMKKGVFKEVDGRKFVLMLWGTLHGLIQFRKLQTTLLKGENHQVLAEYAIDHLVTGLKLL
jgi:TetR/AcrR family transcriptional regulator